MRNTILALSLLLLISGCAQYNSAYRDGFSNPYNDPYAQADFDELLNFSANMANISASARADVCRSLLKSQNGADPGIQLHLLVGRMYSDTCGEISGVLDGVAAIPPGSFHDDRIPKLVDIHTEALKRMNNLPRKVVTVDRKQKAVQTVMESKDPPGPKEATGSKKDEARLLRDKLEAIRSMEKQLDETGGGK
ncbi:MAG: hypothetical protein ACXV7F_08830 [Methylomonas sp.]